MTSDSLFSLDGKRALITGGTRGIGFAIARALAQAGAQVVVSSRSEQACADAVSQLNNESLHATGASCDVAQVTAVDALFAPLDQLDVFVHCAGIASAEFAAQSSEQERKRLMDIHYHGGVECAKRAYERMKGGGSIILVGSIWGLGGASGTLAYGSAKAALLHAMKVMAIEWARDGVRVNALVPGFVDTDMTEAVPDAAKQKMLSRIPLRRAAHADEMAGPALFLASDAASYVTGHALVADGGERAR